MTLELLNLGFAGPNEQGDLCDDPTPNAVIRLQRLRDNGLDGNLCGAGAAAPAVNDYSASLIPTDFYPNMLFDAREGWSRLLAVNAGMNMGGLFSYVAFDANNFRRWIAGQIGATGNQMLNQNGYIIYFSDRRGNHDATNGDVETGEYGHEDSINPADSGLGARRRRSRPARTSTKAASKFPSTTLLLPRRSRPTAKRRMRWPSLASVATLVLLWRIWASTPLSVRGHMPDRHSCSTRLAGGWRGRCCSGAR